jgi:predicted nucleic acid-binding protein
VTHCVLDCSATLAWILPGQATPVTEALLVAVGDFSAIVPSPWKLEVANVLWLAERRGRITLAERTQAFAILIELPIEVDPQTASLAWGATSALAAARELTVYDACYLELALRLGLPLASLDKRLCQAASAAGIILAIT